ncbi:MAG TPA: DUF1028 domain-containing protein [Dehalococcoidia bacterium]|nr:DUF1028 domain-containing protein [Dehalococcoidia bacterium]
MTFSIIARDPRSASFGVAVATAVPCVGAMVPHARSGIGAVATQSFANIDLGRDGLRLLELGMSPRAALEGLLADDPGAARRQVAAIDAQGRTFAFSGDECVDWYGSHEGENYSVQGNMLAGPQVIEAMAAVFEDIANAPLSVRLLAALEAGQAAGGDKRGRQSAALLVTPAVIAKGAPLDFDVRRYELNIRVDEHPQPVAELRRIFEVLLRLGEQEHDEAEARALEREQGAQ